ncbi:hypothetical protein MMC20_007807 [Loxospora ochrophaea]|nr:hypothetical protein [Loxospora ochrophaea]
MVKADCKRDYYADLELSPSADAGEIKKQFKKLGTLLLYTSNQTNYRNTNTVFYLALKYHPDRNPGKEVEFNSKFQAIQCAHEVLADPQQKAKYDADRIRLGSLYNYTSPTRPDIPTRPPNANFPPPTNFPPPPRRPAPPPSTKTTFPTTPASGPNRYANSKFPHPDQSSWSNAKNESQTRTDAFKAWEQMKRSQYGRGAPPKPPRAQKDFAFQPGREAPDGPSNPSRARPNNWDQFQERPPGFPGMSRSHTTRVPPKRNGFDPASKADEPAAASTSAYANVSRGNHFPQNPRPYFPPPRNTQGAGAQYPDQRKPEPLRTQNKRPEPMKPFVPHQPTAEDLTGERIKTPYASSSGEKTYFSSQGLGRSATARDGSSSADWHRANASNPQSPAPSSRQHSASPNMRNLNPEPSYSSSESSSDESLPSRPPPPRRASSNTVKSPQQSNAQDPLRGYRRSSSQTNMRGDSRPEDTSGTNSVHSQTAPIHPLPREGSSDSPEGFLHHRMKRDAERNLQNADAQHRRSGSQAAPTWDGPGPQRPLEKSRSWHEKYGSKEEGNNQRTFDRPATGNAKDTKPMYDHSEHSSSLCFCSPKNWSDQWPFSSRRQPSLSFARPPYWAIPSSLAPRQSNSYENSQMKFHCNPMNCTVNNANVSTPSSFTFPAKHKSFSSTSPLGSRSHETINTNFSPSDWDGKFAGNAEDYLGAKNLDTGNNGRGKTSPTRGRTMPSVFRQPPTSDGETSPRTVRSEMPESTAPFPPPPARANSPAKATFSQEEWSKHFREGRWSFDPPRPSQSPARQTTFKRTKGRRKQSETLHKPPIIPKPAAVTETSDEANGEEVASNVSSSTAESQESQSSNGSDGSAMDIDTSPPSDKQHFASDAPTADSEPSEATPKASRPPISPTQEPLPKDEDSTDLDLGDLKNVSPFVPSESGLGDIKSDLTSTLPFESQPSKGSAQAQPSQRFVPPNPPKAPQVPDKTTQVSWERYIAQMRNYMFEWNQYNAKMLDHFNSKQDSCCKNLGPNWMTARGDGDYVKYMNAVEEDFRVRQHWDISWEKHKECLKGLGMARERVAKMQFSV